MKNISIKQYYELSDADRVEYNLILSALKTQPLFNGRESNLNNLSFTEMKYLFKISADMQDTKILEKVYILFYNLDGQEQFLKAPVADLFSTLKFVRDTIDGFIKKENDLLKMPYDQHSQQWEAAAGNALKPFADIAPLVRLGKLFNVWPSDLGSKKYSEILMYLKYDNEQIKAERRFNELIKNK